jgi:orotate phosphoribosyltransferase
MTHDKNYLLDLQLFDELAALRPVPAGDHLSPEEVDAYVGNRLTDGAERQADAHLASCFECLDAAERAVKEASGVSDEKAPEPRSTTVLKLLASSGAHQTGFDYVMPSGLHVDTHVSVGRVCWSDRAVDALVEAIDWLLAQRSFEAILSHGWPMAHVARRLAWRYRSKVRTFVESEGYEPVIFSRAIPQGASVAILTDVALSGGLAARLAAKVSASGACVAAVVAVVDARNDRSGELLSLCSLDVGRSRVAITKAGEALDRRDFNPCSYNVTVRKKDSRSPLELFHSDKQFAELWARVYVAGAYEHHRVDGMVHHNGFVDTERLLEHPLTGEVVVDDLARLVMAQSSRLPDVLVVPRRHRGRLVGMRLTESIYRATGAMPEVVSVGIRRGRAHISEANRRRLRDQYVVICDSAAGHGETLDILCDVAKTAGASMVGAAIIISRLKESCEEAFRARLAGRFWRLYYFPTPSFMVSQSDPTACPYCATKNSIVAAAHQLDLPALSALAESFAATGGDRSHGRFVRPRATPRSGEDFLRRCERRMAGGVTLHALCTAMNDGMAPLELPEVLDPSIPPAKRAAMLESLPSGALRWSGRWLERSVEECLAVPSPHQVWLAAANLLAREGRGDWINYLSSHLSRGRSHALPRHFWGWLVFNTVSYLSANPRQIAEVRRKVQQVEVEADSAVRAGVAQVLEAIRKVEGVRTGF